MTYRTPNLGGYYNTDEVDFQHHPVPGFENQTLQIDSDGQNGYYHSSTELHRFAQNADRYTTNRNGHWTGNYGGSTTQVTEGSPSGSQSALLHSSSRSRRSLWPKGKDFLFSTWAFVVGAHSLWELPVLTLRYGGVVFILVYLAVFLILGSPLLLLEMGLGQYSALSVTKLYRHLCPVLTGVGFAVCISCIVNAMTDLAVISWSGQAIFQLFSGQAFPENFFFSKVLDTARSESSGENSRNLVGLENLGDLHGQLALCLGIAAIVIFICIAASTKSIGKVSMIIVPVCYGLLMTLTIRGCMGSGGPQGVLALLTPDWNQITKPWVWLEATRVVFLSLQLGLGVISTYASYNKFHHNIIRDAGIIAIGHFVWSILGVIFVFSLLGISHNTQSINIDQLRSNTGSWSWEDGSVIAITGRNFWLIGITLAESSLASLEYNWLWSGLLFILIILTLTASVIGCIEVLASCTVDEFSNIRGYKPAIIFTFVASIFMLDLSMATKGGIHLYYLLTTYYTLSWPLLFFGIATVIAAAYSHGGKYLMKDLGDMSKMPLTHYISSHLSVLYSTVVPILLMCTLGWTLFTVSQEHLTKPLANFNIRLPNDWGMPLGWAITFIPFAIIVAGLLFNMLWMSRGIPFKMHFKRSFKPTDSWYENEHRELIQQELTNGSVPKDSPIIAFNHANNKRNGNTTEV